MRLPQLGQVRLIAMSVSVLPVFTPSSFFSIKAECLTKRKGFRWYVWKWYEGETPGGWADCLPLMVENRGAFIYSANMLRNWRDVLTIP
jgi:hypothetical protein